MRAREKAVHRPDHAPFLACVWVFRNPKDRSLRFSAQPSFQDGFLRFAWFSGFPRDGRMIGWPACLRILPHGFHHLLHSLHDFPHLRMHFLDQVMFNLGERFNAVSLFFKLGQQRILA